jgi:hypothetical protein
MAKAVTEAFHEMVLEVEDEVTAGTWIKICGLTERGVNRTHNMATTEVPDCDDESLPAALERAVQSSEVTVAASGSWAAQSHGLVMDWWYSSQPKNVRIQNVKAETGDTEFEEGMAYLTSLNNVATRGQKVTADMTFEFDGLPVRTAATA